jgi:hypothetical protein
MWTVGEGEMLDVRDHSLGLQEAQLWEEHSTKNDKINFFNNKAGL